MDIQRLSALLSTPLQQPRLPETAQGLPDFGQYLKTAIAQVEQDQKAADLAGVRLATGQVKDVSEVMVASSRASLSLGLAVQVRNKMLEAYQEIMRMPL